MIFKEYLKQSEKLNEAIDSKLIKKIAKMTDNNDHTGARLEIAEKILKNKKLAEAYKGIGMIHMFIGHLPNQLSDLRYNMDNQYLKPSLKQKLSDDEFESVWGAL